MSYVYGSIEELAAAAKLHHKDTSIHLYWAELASETHQPEMNVGGDLEAINKAIENLEN